jgi:nucleoside diphosphate kinase
MQANNKDAIISKIKETGFKIVQEREVYLSKEQAGLFYREHIGKPFFENLTTWMSR